MEDTDYGSQMVSISNDFTFLYTFEKLLSTDTDPLIARKSYYLKVSGIEDKFRKIAKIFLL